MGEDFLLPKAKQQAAEPVKTAKDEDRSNGTEFQETFVKKLTSMTAFFLALILNAALLWLLIANSLVVPGILILLSQRYYCSCHWSRNYGSRAGSKQSFISKSLD
jgi:hypothetical protein